jgi:MFS family permease
MAFRAFSDQLHHPLTRSLIFPAHVSLLFLVAFSDALLSYIIPVFLEQHLINTLIFGMIMSIPSLIGLMVDFWIGTFGVRALYRNLIVFAVLSLLLLPLVLILLPSTPFYFVIAMMLWGLYYEFMHFSNFQIINHQFEPKKHALGWGIISGTKNTAYLIGPLIAGGLLVLNPSLTQAFRLPLIVTLLALPLVLFLRSRTNASHHRASASSSLSLSQTLSLAYILLTKVWPLVACIIMLYMMDAAFWTIGILLSQSLKDTLPLGGLLITAYVLPSLLVAGLIYPLSKPWGKKRIGIVATAVAGIIYSSLFLVPSSIVLIGVVFTAALFHAIAIPELLSAFEDYIDRLDHLGNIMISIESFAASIGYILGPLIAGALALAFTFPQTLSLMGLLMTIIAFISLIIVPRKIKLPRSQIAKISS